MHRWNKAEAHSWDKAETHSGDKVEVHNRDDDEMQTAGRIQEIRRYDRAPLHGIIKKLETIGCIMQSDPEVFK